MVHLGCAQPLVVPIILHPLHIAVGMLGSALTFREGQKGCVIKVKLRLQEWFLSVLLCLIWLQTDDIGYIPNIRSTVVTPEHTDSFQFSISYRCNINAVHNILHTHIKKSEVSLCNIKIEYLKE